MARKTLKDDEGNSYEVDIPDDDDGDDEDEDAIYLDEDDVTWLKDQRRKASEESRKGSASETGGKKKPAGKVIRIRAKQESAGSPSSSQTKTRKRVLRLA